MQINLNCFNMIVELYEELLESIKNAITINVDAADGQLVTLMELPHPGQVGPPDWPTLSLNGDVYWITKLIFAGGELFCLGKNVNGNVGQTPIGHVSIKKLARIADELGLTIEDIIAAAPQQPEEEQPVQPEVPLNFSSNNGLNTQGGMQGMSGYSGFGSYTSQQSSGYHQSTGYFQPARPQKVTIKEPGFFGKIFK
jgi:hypothetical protein